MISDKFFFQPKVFEFNFKKKLSHFLVFMLVTDSQLLDHVSITFQLKILIYVAPYEIQ